ncbi:MAG: alanine:cation symporter family protein [Bacteroidaceae bacterium]|nr:alanine:cation symporter family protein [Bacteroidaceae bacterium]
MLNILNEVNDFLWTYIVITLLVICAVYFTIKTKGVQFRSLKETWSLLKEKPKQAGIETAPSTNQKKKSVNSFQAFAISLSSRVGTGNLAGVASAIFVGGPGAVFWMWVMALLGAATAFVESTLAQLYKKKGKDAFYGGPAYYMQNGLKKKWMGILFAVLITITFGMANQTVQSNTLCDALADSMGIEKIVVGVALTIMTLIIIFGGVQRIAKFSSIVVPFMAVGYILLALYIMAINITHIPEMIGLIIDNAFGLKQMGGGVIGIAIMEGVKRGLFSNEAGEGSAPNAAATADISHPVKQGLLQAVGVFADTLVICTCTAFMILLSGLYDGELDGILLTKAAIVSEIGVSGGWFLTAAIFLFAYSTIIANYFYGETNIRFITQKKWAVNTFRIITGVTVMLGALVSLQTAWSMVDICMGLMTICNLIAILLLSGKAFKLLNNYLEQRKQGRNPEFHRNMMPEIEKDIECWE